MTEERGLSHARHLALQVVRDVLEHLDVRIDALGLDRAARRRVIARGGQLERAALAERQNGLNRPLAEAARADQRGALEVLQRARDDFRCGSRTAVYEHDERFLLRE